MYTYVKLKNFKSLVDFKADFTSKKDTPKKLIVIYGENGAGKTNFIESFNVLSKIIKGEEIRYITSKYKTIETPENMLLEFGFKLNGKNGVYRIEITNNSLVSEYLEFTLNKNKVVLIDTKNDKYNDYLFSDKTSKRDMKSIKKYCCNNGYSLLPKICDFYDKDNLNKDFLNIMSFLKGGIGFNLLPEGVIRNERSYILDKTEPIYNNFFSRLYSDIKKAYFKKDKSFGEIQYQLYFKKLINNNIVDINTNEESTGTKNLIQNLNMLLNCTDKGISIIDNAGLGIHDVLFCHLIENIAEQITGQLIITTHNTALLELDVIKNKKSACIINIDCNGNREFIVLSDFERLHPSLNVRKRYLQGLYGGIPSSMSIDFEELNDI